MITSHWTFLNDLTLTEKFIIVDHLKEDHNEREFKHLIISQILDLVERSAKTSEALYKWSTTLLILHLLKMFSKVILASRRSPLAKIEKQTKS